MYGVDQEDLTHIIKAMSEYKKAAEYLRLTIPMLSQHKITPNPRNYAVFYEYVCNNNDALHRAFDLLNSSDKQITDEHCTDLYQHYIVDAEEGRLQKARTELQSIIIDLLNSLSSSDKEVMHFNDSLENYAKQLKQSIEGEELKNILDALSHETVTMHKKGGHLYDRLNQNEREIKSLRRELERVREESTIDSLSGLLNRKAFDHAIKEMIHSVQENSTPLCMMLIDIDKFKQVNDTYGHLLGDKVIRFTANNMKNSVKGRDIVARYGGEEFAILLPETDVVGAYAAAENIRLHQEKGRLIKGGSQEAIRRVTISIGVSSYRSGESVNEFMQRVDDALYKAKNSGRNTVIVG